MKIEYGECIYCGQVRQFEVEDGISLSPEEKNRKATEQCDCDDAKNVHAQEKILTTTQKNISSLFHKDKPEMEKLLLEAEDRMRELGVTDLYDPEQNMEVAADYLQELFEKYEDVGTVLMVYHGESGAVSKIEPSQYADEILTRSAELERLHGK